MGGWKLDLDGPKRNGSLFDEIDKPVPVKKPNGFKVAGKNGKLKLKKTK